MKIGRRSKMIGVAAIVLLIGVPYAVYAMEYRGEYDVTVSFDVQLGDTIGEVDVTNLEVESEPMDMMSFWDALKGASGEVRWNHSIYAELNVTGDDDPTEMTYALLSDDSATRVTLTFREVPPGSAQLRIYIVWNIMDQTVYDYTHSVVVG